MAELPDTEGEDKAGYRFSIQVFPFHRSQAAYGFICSLPKIKPKPPLTLPHGRIYNNDKLPYYQSSG